MDRPGVYIGTRVVSYLAALPSRDPVTLRNQKITRAWWDRDRHRFGLRTSGFVIAEATAGDAALAQQRIALLAPVSLLPVRRALVVPLAAASQRGIPLPRKAAVDAFHIALSAVENVTYLLTWDTKHIANPKLRRRMDQIILAAGYTPPVCCSPAELMKG